jgi:hypothetical protein
MIIGAHAILYSRDAEADRVFLRDVLNLRGVDAGGGWLIFGLPPAELAVHPSDRNDVRELYLLCDDIAEFVAEMKRRKVPSSPIEKPSWGLLTYVTLPGGGRLGVYEPKHARPLAGRVSRSAKRR